MPQPQRRVAENDQIEHPEVARSSEYRLRRRGDPQPADQVYRERSGMAAYQLRRSERRCSFLCERRRSRRQPKRDPRGASEASGAIKSGLVLSTAARTIRSRAAVRCEKAAVRGRTSCHAARSSNCVRLSAAAYTPRVIRSHSRSRSHPRAGERGLFSAVTPEACGRGLQSSEPLAHLWTGLGAGSLLWKPVTCQRPPGETGSPANGLLAKPVTSNLKMGRIQVGSDRFL